jgi:hypothetical protein
MRLILLEVTLSLAVAMISCSGKSIAATLYGGGYSSKSLYRIDLTTGSKTPVLTGLGWGINGLAFNSKDKHFYATIVDFETVPSHPIAYYKIDPVDLSVELAQFTGIMLSHTETVDGLEYDPTRDVFWGIGWVKTQFERNLIRIDAATGQAQIVGQLPLPFVFVSGLAFDAQNDILYGIHDSGPVENGTATLLAIDPATADATTIGEPGLGLGLYDVDSLVFNPTDRMIYAINDGRDGGPHLQQLVRIDPTTGVTSLLGVPDGNLEFYQGLAFVIPEPSCVGTALCAVVLLSGSRRFRGPGSHRQIAPRQLGSLP